MNWTDDQRKAAEALIKRHEGIALKPYTDGRGFLTVGYGRCLTTRGITIAEAEMLFANDLDGTLANLALNDWWNQLDPVRRVAIADMAFNLGAHGVLGFRDMIAALLQQRWGAAADAMLASRWAQQVPHRASDDRIIVLTGRLP